MGVSSFGVASDGVEVLEVRIAGGGLSAAFLTWGCVTRDLRLDGLARPLTLGLASIDEYERHGGQHVGVIAGRCANRIAGGRFVIDGVEHQTTQNASAGATLHAGERGFGRAHWRLVDYGADHAAFAIRQEDGHEGFPGAIEAHCVYRLREGALEIELTARADAPTLCNLAQHNYYNLSGAARVDDHELWLAASAITPLGADMTPTGRIELASTARDFSRRRRIGAAAIDVNYILADGPRATPAPAARLRAGGVEMLMETTAPGVQLYTGDNLTPPPLSASGAPLGLRAGLCLEPQLWPDAAHHPHFPCAILRPGEEWRQVTRLSFSRMG